LLPDFFLLHQGRIGMHLLLRGDGVASQASDPLFPSNFPLIHFKRPRAVPNHENSEWYPMLLSMSKRSFAEPVFTLGVRSSAYIWAFSPSKYIYDLLYFHRITKFLRNSPALHCFPVGRSHLDFSVGAGSSMKKVACRGRPKFRHIMPARNLPGASPALWMTLQSHPRPRHKEDHDERSKPE
jgi:hypothetical protein